MRSKNQAKNLVEISVMMDRQEGFAETSNLWKSSYSLLCSLRNRAGTTPVLGVTISHPEPMHPEMDPKDKIHQPIKIRCLATRSTSEGCGANSHSKGSTSVNEVSNSL